MNKEIKVTFTPPEPLVLNEAFGSMALSDYNKAVKETSKWEMFLYMVSPFKMHPYLKYKNENSIHK